MFQDKIRQIIAALDDTAELSKKEATAEIFSESLDRIFKLGEDKDQSQIGQYDDSKKQTFLTNKVKLTKKQREKADQIGEMTYKELRRLRGLQTSYVDLTFSGNLKKSIGLNDKQVYFKNEYGQKISSHNEQHFKKRIFAPSENERQIFFRTLRENFNKLWKSTSS